MVRKSGVFAFLEGLALDPLQSGMHRGGLSAAHQGNMLLYLLGFKLFKNG